MLELEHKILPYFFAILMGFIIVNLLMNLSVYSFSKIKNIKMLSWYWFSLLLTFAFQSQFQNNELSIILSYSSCGIPVTIMSMIIFNTMDKRAPVNLYLILWLVALAVTPLLYLNKLSFTIVSLPLSLAMGFIPLSTAYVMMKQDQKSATILQKFMCTVFILTFIHFLNFSFFRMVPGTQLWGHGASFALYQIYSVSIFALIFEDYSKKEKVRLQQLVDERTTELSKALTVKETLFRMVLHDIATPIQSQIWAIELLKQNRKSRIDPLKRLGDMTYLVKDVVEQVRNIEAISSGKIKIDPTPVNLQKCLASVQMIFENQFDLKNITFHIRNDLGPETMFLADQNVFTTSILGNLISNAIKFSPENSELILHAYEKNNKVIIEVEDKGVGMSKELSFSIFDPTKKSNRVGTNGETGTGFGMVQVKSYVEHFGGQVHVESRPMDLYPSNHGTKIRLTMDKTMPTLQESGYLQ